MGRTLRTGHPHWAEGGKGPPWAGREEEGQVDRYVRRSGRKGLENGEDSRVQTAQTAVSRKMERSYWL